MHISALSQYRSCSLVLVLLLALLQSSGIRGFIFFQGRTTACDICDRVSTMSVRNTMCCLKFSTCCMPDSLDEYNAQAAREDALGHSNYPAKVHVPRTDSEIAAATARTARSRAAKSRRKQTTSGTQKRRRAASTTANKRRNSKRRASSSAPADRVITIEGWWGWYVSDCTFSFSPNKNHFLIKKTTRTGAPSCVEEVNCRFEYIFLHLEKYRWLYWCQLFIRLLGRVPFILVQCIVFLVLYCRLWFTPTVVFVRFS